MVPALDRKLQPPSKIPPPVPVASLRNPSGFKSKQIGFALLVGFIGIVGFWIASRTSGARLDHRRNSVRIHAKLVGSYLKEFEQDYGAFPSETIRLAHPSAFAGSPPLSDSNSFLGLLIAGGYTGDEEIFHVPNSLLPPKWPDNIISPPERRLEPGECGFSLVAGLTSKDDPKAPLLLAPMIPGTTRFESQPLGFGGMVKACVESVTTRHDCLSLDRWAVILHVDQTVTEHRVTRSGQVFIEGKDIFDPTQPYWRGKSPDLRHPAR